MATVYFAATTLDQGRELWKSDGTPAGTVLVKDIWPGGSSSPDKLTNVNGTLFFRAYDPTNGNELWRSDGTSAGTVLVRDISPGSSGSGPDYLTRVAGTLFFRAYDPTNGYELWKSDGTSAALVMDIWPGSTSGSPEYLTNANGTLFFQARDPTNGLELWKSDGTSTGTVLVRDIYPGNSDSFPDKLTNVNGALFFRADDPTNGYELWKSDGTSAGTMLVRNIASGGTGSDPDNLTNVNGTLFFRANDWTNGSELWKSDGTSAGTVLVRDIRPGFDGSGAANLTDVNGTLFLRAFDPTNGHELWKSDGTSAGTVLVRDVWPGSVNGNPYDLANVSGTLFFGATDPTNGQELWKSDGTSAGTVLVKDIFPGDGSGPDDLTNVDGTLFFRAYDPTNGYELWKSDGTSAGTVRITAYDDPNALPGPLVALAVDDTLPPAVSAPDLVAADDSGTSDADNLTNETAPTFVGTGEEDAVVRLLDGTDTLGTATVDGGSWTIVSDTLAEGVHTLVAHATDGAGNTAVSAPLTITVDTAAPETTVVSGPATLTSRTTAIFDFGPSEAGIIFAAELDDGGYTAATDALTLAGLGHGTHTLLVHATDAAGNTDATDFTYVWTVDTVAPAVSAPDLAAADDSGTSDTDDLTNETAPAFVGTGEEDAVVRLLEGTDTLGTATVDGGSWTIVADTLAEGIHTLVAHATDAAGNTAVSGPLTITVDTEAPETTVVSGPAALTNEAAATFDFGPAEAGITFAAKLDDGGYTAATDPLTLTGLGHGTHTLLVHATDAAGNVDATDFTYVWTVDTMAPAVSAPDLAAADDSGTSDADDLTNEAAPAFVGTGEEDAVVLLLEGTDTLGTATVDGGSWTIVSDTLAEGVHTLVAHATDAAGNTTVSGPLTITVDTEAPETTVVSGPAALTNDPTATFDFGPAEAGITFAAKLDEGSFETVTDPLVLSAIGHGSHTLLVHATDAAGNTDATDFTYVWTVDNMAPAVSAPDLVVADDSGTSQVDDLTNETTPTFVGTGEEDAVVRLFDGADTLGTTTVDGGAWTILSSMLAEGVHTLVAHATDAAGNTTVSDALTVTIDTAAPETSIAAAPSGLVASGAAAFSFAAEAGAGFEVALDGGGWSAAASTHSLSGLADGIHTLAARAVDAAGNADATPAMAVWTVDTSPPQTTIVAGPSGATSRTTAIFDFGSADGGAGFEVALDGGGWSAATDPATFAGLADGPHTLLVRAVDMAGNVDPTPALRSWIIDSSVPAGPTVTGIADDTGEPGDGVTTDRSLTVRGTGDAGTTVHLLRNGTEVATGAVAGDGRWSVADPAMLAVGTHRYTAYATDVAENASGVSAPFAVFAVDAKAGGSGGGDVLASGAGNGNLDGKDGDDTLFGEAGNDTVKGGNGADHLSGGGDQDALWGGNGNDAVDGGPGRDTLYGESGDDVLSAGDGDDRIEGGIGSDAIDAGAGADTITGGDGKDTVSAGPGADRLLGEGSGDWIVLGDDEAKDTVFGTVAHLSGDTIGGFETGKGGDVIAITGLAATSGKYLDSLAVVEGVLSLSKVGGGAILFDDLAGTHYTDTVLGSDGSLLLYVV